MSTFDSAISRMKRALRGAAAGAAGRPIARPTTGQSSPTDGRSLGERSASRALSRLIAALVLGACSFAFAATDAFLDPDDAFRATASAQPDGRAIVVDWEVAPGYHLYGDRLSASAIDPRVRLGPIERPAGERADDPVLGRTVEKLEGRFQMRIPVLSADRHVEVALDSQGCAAAGLCYPPQTRRIAVDLPAAVGPQATVDSPAAVGPQATVDSPAAANASRVTPPAVAVAAIDDDALIARTLDGRSLPRIALVFLALGVLLSFTPCVLPMVPILASIIVGAGTSVTRSRGLVLSLAYSLGMALVYTAMGVAAGLAGEGLAAAFQHPAVLGAFALLLGTLALSMFGVFTVQMPAGLQGRLTQLSNRLPAGRLLPVFAMGALSAMIVGPCVAAPLAGALVYIGRTRDVAIGATALFALAMGMSGPLLLTGLSAGNLLPHAGRWMNAVKSFFGVLLLAVAIWMVSPVLPPTAAMLAWAALAIGCASWLRVFDPLPDDAPGHRRLAKAVGVMLLIGATLQAVGIALGSDDPLHPLARLASGPRQSADRAAVAFAPLSDPARLDATVSAAGRPVLLDFYADWCVACKEMERFTLSDPEVRRRLGEFALLRVDVTRNDTASRDLMKRFGLFGPPAIVFLDGRGELPDSRIVGFRPAADVVARLDRIRDAQAGATSR